MLIFTSGHCTARKALDVSNCVYVQDDEPLTGTSISKYSFELSNTTESVSW